MNILQAAKELTGGVSWNLRGDVLEQADDGSDPVIPPTNAAIQAHIAADPTAYKEQRRKAYPPIGDQLDALWKGGQDEADMKAIINAIKVQFPKP